MKTILKQRWTLGLALLLAAGAAQAAKRSGPDMTLEQMTRASDAVVIGTVKDKKARWVKGHIETDYEIQVEEALKGGKSFRSGQTFRMTVMGGESTSPPISQFTEAQAHMFKGEDVALFLRTTPAGTDKQRQRAASVGSNLFTTPRVVGMNQGKFSVVTDAKDGRRKLTRVSLESYGFLPSDTTLSRVLRAVAQRDVDVTSGPVVSLGGGLVTSPDGKAMLDAAAANDPASARMLDALTGAKPIRGAAGAPSAAPRQVKNVPIPLQDLEEFKNQVRQFAN